MFKVLTLVDDVDDVAKKKVPRVHYGFQRLLGKISPKKLLNNGRFQKLTTWQE